MALLCSVALIGRHNQPYRAPQPTLSGRHNRPYRGAGTSPNQLYRHQPPTNLPSLPTHPGTPSLTKPFLLGFW